MFRLGLFSGVRPTRRLWLPAIGLVVVSGMFLAPPICRAGALFQLDRVTPYAMPIAPGSSATYILRITNIGDAAAIAPPYAVFYYENQHDPAAYTFEQSSDPRCGPLHVDAPYPGSWEYGPAFETASLAPDDSLECNMTIVRPPASIRDTSVYWTVRDTDPPYAFRSDQALIGTLANTSASARNIDFSIDSGGYAHSLIEISVHNGASVAIRAQSLGTCIPPFPPFRIDGDFEGGCGQGNYGPGCPNISFGYPIPQLDPVATYRCLVKLQSIDPYTVPLEYSLLSLGLQQGVGTGTLMNVNPNGGRLTLVLEPLETATPVPANRLLGGLAILLLVAALMRLRYSVRS